MPIDKNQVIHIARLARLGIVSSDAKIDPQIDPQIDKYVAQLSDILALVEKMNAVDTDSVAPMAHPHPAALRLRDDAVTAENRRDDFQRIAPATEQGLYLTPRVIE